MTDPDSSCVPLARRRLLLMGVAGAATLLGGPAVAALPSRRVRSLSFHHLHTGESLRTVYWADGRYLPEALAQINRLLRDFRTGEEYAIDQRLFDVLHALGRRLDTEGPFHVISGYRSPRTNAMLQRTGGGGVSSRSLHMVGMAIDIRMPERRTLDVYDAARSLQAGGAGHYPRSDFVHIDTGRVRFW